MVSKGLTIVTSVRRPSWVCGTFGSPLPQTVGPSEKAATERSVLTQQVREVLDGWTQGLGSERG